MDSTLEVEYLEVIKIRSISTLHVNGDYNRLRQTSVKLANAESTEIKLISVCHLVLNSAPTEVNQMRFLEVIRHELIKHALGVFPCINQNLNSLLLQTRQQVKLFRLEYPSNARQVKSVRQSSFSHFNMEKADSTDVELANTVTSPQQKCHRKRNESSDTQPWTSSQPMQNIVS